MTSALEEFRRARDLLLSTPDARTARAHFRWPRLDRFNWALDWFDVIARGNARIALRVVDDGGSTESRSFDDLARRSDQVATFFRERGARRGDRLLLMLGNVTPLWETVLAAIKSGLVIIPATTQLTADDLRDRLQRGAVRHVVTDAAGAARVDAVGGDFMRTVVGGAAPGWTPFADAEGAAPAFTPDAETHASDPLLLYFTSGTTARPKLVLHTHASYPVGHLSTMYWIGMREGDVHLNISSPGWAKHAWSSVFAPWNAGAAILVHNAARFSAARLIELLGTERVATLCAPPTVWRMVIGEPLPERPAALREVVSAGEPLNPEVIERVRRAWGLTIRDGYGQTETSAQIGNPPGEPLREGSMGRPLPGFDVALLDLDGQPADEGEVALRLDPPPTGLMVGYADDAERTAEVMRGGYYHTGDVARRDADGYITFVGRTDDVFKSSDYRISPFELESALLELPIVAEAAVVPAPDPLRLAVPKAFVVLRPGAPPDREAALAILRFARERLAAYKRVRRIEFAELPKTISGKIRRVELRVLEEERASGGTRPPREFRDDDFPELRG